jgi:phytoene desaturase (3,4-didehydrolycopene-forming)
MENEGIELVKCDPNYTIYFDPASSTKNAEAQPGAGKGETFPEKFVLSTDMAHMKREIERLEGPDGFKRYLEWLREAHHHNTVADWGVLHKPFSTYLSLLRYPFCMNIISLHPFTSVHARARKYFKSDALRRVFTFGSMYMGMSPYNAPGVYSLLQYTELAEGVWYPKGGFQVVVQKLVDISKKLGVEYRLETAVDRVLEHEDKHGVTSVRGVRLESGEELKADMVIVNADLVWAYNHLFDENSQFKTGPFSQPPSADRPSSKPLDTSVPNINDHVPESYPEVIPTTGATVTSSPPTPSPYALSLNDRPTSCSSISYYWSLSTTVPELGSHTIFLASEYRESFDSIFDKHVLPTDPSFYVNLPSRHDPSAAPPGKDAMIVLVPTGHLTSTSPASYDAIVEKLRDEILSTIKARTGIDIKPLITHEIVNDPYIWRKKFNLDRGAILGLSHGFFNVLAFRPKWRHEKIKNCWFVGASTHPGTGVPIVLAGAKLLVDEIGRDGEKDNIFWSTAEAMLKPVFELAAATFGQETHADMSQLPGVQFWLFMLVLIFAVLAMALNLR